MTSHSTSRPRSEHRRNDSPSALQPGCLGDGAGGTCHCIRRYVTPRPPHCQGDSCNASPHAFAGLQATQQPVPGGSAGHLGSRRRSSAAQSPSRWACCHSAAPCLMASRPRLGSSSGRVNPSLGPACPAAACTQRFTTPHYCGPPIMDLTDGALEAAHTLTRPKKANHSVKFRAPPPTNVMARWLITG